MSVPAGRIQRRGHCPHCGREQAVRDTGLVAKHGYMIENGWFSGVCAGHQHKPLEIDRSQADRVVAQVGGEAASLREYAARLAAGTARPAIAKTRRQDSETQQWAGVVIPFAEASAAEQQDAIEQDGWFAEARALAGEAFARNLAQLADKIHGKPLRKVRVVPPAPPILIGERRRFADGTVGTVKHVRRGTVDYAYDDNGVAKQSWSSARVWRQLEVVD